MGSQHAHLHPGSGGEGGADAHPSPLCGASKPGFGPVNFLRQLLAFGKQKSLPDLQGSSQAHHFECGSSHRSECCRSARRLKGVPSAHP